MREGPILRFESTAFPAAKYEDPETNPDMVAKAVADWLSVRLNERGVKTLGVFSEDFGWCVGVPTKPREWYVACGRVEGRESDFEVTYFSIGGLFSIFFGRNRTEENLNRLHRTVKEILGSSPKIGRLREES
jgi:hypothetical protein